MKPHLLDLPPLCLDGIVDALMDLVRNDRVEACHLAATLACVSKDVRKRMADRLFDDVIDPGCVKAQRDAIECHVAATRSLTEFVKRERDASNASNASNASVDHDCVLLVCKVLEDWAEEGDVLANWATLTCPVTCSVRLEVVGMRPRRSRRSRRRQNESASRPCVPTDLNERLACGMVHVRTPSPTRSLRRRNAVESGG